MPELTLANYIKSAVCRLPRKHARALVVACEIDSDPLTAYTFCQRYRRKTVDYDREFYEVLGEAVWRRNRHGQASIRVGNL